MPAETTQTNYLALRRAAMLSSYFNVVRGAGSQDLSHAQDFRLPPEPYPGLRSFNPEEGENFFGRERNIRAIQQRLASQSIVVVLGGSGSGKSSVIRAGLMPRLNSTMSIEGRSGNWYTTEFRPRQKPMEELVNALNALVASKFEEPTSDTGATETNRGVRELQTLLVSRFLQSPTNVPEDRRRRAERLARGLLSFVDSDLDKLDATATKRYRSGTPNLLLVIDQFEELFRPEVPVTGVGGRQEFLDMLIAIYGRLERGGSAKQSGLFLAITMRSEDLHRCTEHPALNVFVDGEARQRTLADVVNGSGYLLDLLDPRQDRQQLTEAIVKPARRVFEEWGIPLDSNSESAPFQTGVVTWLLDGAVQVADQLDHRADQLPLLQHALQTIWHGAILDWSRHEGDSYPLTISRKHLLGSENLKLRSPAADLVGCLDNWANTTRENAVERFVSKTRALGTTEDQASLRRVGGLAVRAAFRSLARRDDRGNWTRRFAELERIIRFIDADSTISGLSGEVKKVAAEEALQAFVSAGYISGGAGRAYDVNHEALIRNWREYQLWLLDPEEAAQALVQAVNFMNVERPADAISYAIARSLLGPLGHLPEEWAVEQIVPLLSRRALRMRWAQLDPAYGEDDENLARVVLHNITAGCKLALAERFRRDSDAYWFEIVRRQRVQIIMLSAFMLMAVIALGVSALRRGSILEWLISLLPSMVK